MGYRKYMFLLLLAAVLIAGCSQQDRPVPFEDTHPVIEVAEPLSVIESSGVKKLDILEVTEPNGALTLRQALALALMQNPGLKTHAWDVRVSEARQLQAGLWPNPELEVEVEEVGGPGQRSDFDGAETTILLSQLIELGDKRTKRTKLAALEKQLTDWDYKAKRLDVFTEVAKAFVDVLAEQERTELAEELVKLSKDVLNTVRQRVQAGKDSPVEQTKAQVALANVEIDLSKAKSNLESARKRLSATWAGKSPSFEKAAGELDSTVPVPSLDELTRLIDQNPDIARWTAEMDQRRAALELAKANAVQDVRLGAGMQRFNETDDNAVVFGVAIPIPLFDRNQGDILEATHRIARARAQRQAIEASIHTALAEAYAKLSSAYHEATALKNKVLEGAQSAFDAASEGYRTGKLGFLDVLDAQRTLFEAKVKYIDALAVYHTAKTDAERLIGHPIDSIAVSKNED